MKLSIIGAGQVGQALAGALIRSGQPVVLGVTDPGKYAPVAEALGGQLAPVGEAIQGAEAIILAVPYGAVAAIAQSVPDWAGRILVDATNPLAPKLSGLSLGTTTSGAEMLATQAYGARVVKAFNTTGAENLADSAYPDGLPVMPVCGDDAAARQSVMVLATRIGFDAVDLGPLMAARYLEAFAMTWIHLAIKQGYGRRFAFGLLRRP